MKNLCSLIPSYNEGRTIGEIVRRLKARDIDAYVIDDGSNDDTYQKAQAEGAVVIRNEKNLGKGASLRKGFKHLVNKRYSAIVVMDGDGQHDVNDIDAFIRRMEETDAGMIIGNRMRDTSTMPILRIAVNRFMSYLLSRLAGVRIPDTQCGFRLIKKEVVRSLKLRSSNYEIESEMIIETARSGFRIESVPIKTLYQNEKSRINPVADTLRFLVFLSKHAKRTKEDR